MEPAALRPAARVPDEAVGDAGRRRRPFPPNPPSEERKDPPGPSRRHARRPGSDPAHVASAFASASRYADHRDGDQDPPDPYAHVPSESDSSDDDDINTIGNVPLAWYRHEDHIGYDRSGGKISKTGAEGDTLDRLIARSEGGKSWRTLRDPFNGEDVTLTKDEVRMLMRIRSGQLPHGDVDPHADFGDWFTRHQLQEPLTAAPEPKRRFVPSKWEAKKVVQLVRALRRGWLKTEERKRQEEEEAWGASDVYDMWGDDGAADDGTTAAGLTHIPAPKMPLPGHEESYRPPAEYIPTEEELMARAADKDGDSAADPRALVPRAFDCLRHVPAYGHFVHERFERCLDLYLCPRVQRQRHFVDPASLRPQLPKPSELEPFPKFLCLRFRGHDDQVNDVTVDPSGQMVASASDDGSVRVWECQTGRCLASWDLGARVTSVAFRPAANAAASPVLAAAAGRKVHLLCPPIGNAAARNEARECVSAGRSAGGGAARSSGDASCSWLVNDDTGGAEIGHAFVVERATWHARGDYLVSVAPDGQSRSVVLHHLPTHVSQSPFRKHRGTVRAVLFHPRQPFLFVATDRHVRVYNLAKQELAKRLQVGGAGVLRSLDVHPSGDHLIAGMSDGRICWFDLDLSTRPYRTLRYHALPATAVAFHRHYPLFASSSDDGTCHVFHGMVYSDLTTNPLIVPVKVLRAPDDAATSAAGGSAVGACCFHTTQPWIVAGAGNDVLVFCH